MEYIYAAMLLHKAGKQIDEAGLRKVLEAAGVKADESRIKALVASLHGVNIDEVVKQASVAPAVSAPSPEEKKPVKHEKAEEKKEEKKDEMSAAAGLGALFG
jgi:large subunit ribosomal protein L12